LTHHDKQKYVQVQHRKYFIIVLSWQLMISVVYNTWITSEPKNFLKAVR